MVYYVAYLCGHMYNLAIEEFLACMNAEKTSYQLLKIENQLVHFLSKDSPVKAVQRCALTHCLIQVIAEGQISGEQLNITKEYPISNIPEQSSYVARVYKIGDKKHSVPTPKLEREIGTYFGQKGKEYNLKVNLKQPDMTIRGIVIDMEVIIGIELWHINRKEYLSRDPGSRPVFLPGSMKAEFARAMVNLSQIKAGDIFYDPFCGSGGMLIEALTIGAYSIGSDISYRAINASLANLAKFRKGYYSVMLSDSRTIPLHKVDAIVTDPPYAIQSSTHGEDVVSLIEKFLLEAKRVLKTSGRLVISAPSWAQLDKIMEKCGFNVLNKIDVRIHKSLTRRVVIGKVNAR